MRRNIVWSGIGTGLLLSFALYMYSLLSTEHLERLQACEDIVVRIQSISGRWLQEVSNIRLQSAFNYDVLVSLTSESDTLHRELSAHARATQHTPPSTKRAMKRFVLALDLQRNQVERFKLGFSALHNSAKYLPLGLVEAQRLLLQVPEADRPRSERVLSDFRALVSSIALSRESGSRSDVAILQARVERVRPRSATLPPLLGRHIDTLLSHANVVVTHSDDVLRAYDKIDSSKVTQYGQVLNGLLRVEHDQLQIRHRYVEYAIVASLSLILVVWVRLLLLLLFSSFRVLPSFHGSSSVTSESRYPERHGPSPGVSQFPPSPSPFDLDLAERARSGELASADMLDTLRYLISPLAPDGGPDPVLVPVSDFLELVSRPGVSVRVSDQVLRLDLRISSAISHLIDNALRSFDPDDGSEVRLTIGRAEVGTIITVSDDGCGMSPGEIGAATSLFYTTRDRALGLGLPSAIRVCEQIGGRLVLRSQPGRGTLVRVLLFEGEV